ncbi:hypothetical protein VE03_08853 [Pseudogymnoascus sp. 23342-1-I1]|nr:hypothetical protein VE03_08853 [Pseudogymnoascus sp. 23342-1-I1]
MSNRQPPNPQASKKPSQSDHDTITANATLIWSKEGPSFDFDTDIETDDYEYYYAFLSVIRPDAKGGLSRIPLMMTTLHKSGERAMQELEHRLKDMVKRGVKLEVQPHHIEEFSFENALKVINGMKL